MALGLGPDDWLIVPSMTFLATANAARFVGAEVEFADVDADTGLLTEATLAAALERAQTRRPAGQGGLGRASRRPYRSARGTRGACPGVSRSWRTPATPWAPPMTMPGRRRASAMGATERSPPSPSIR